MLTNFNELRVTQKNVKSVLLIETFWYCTSTRFQAHECLYQTHCQEDKFLFSTTSAWINVCLKYPNQAPTCMQWGLALKQFSKLAPVAHCLYQQDKTADHSFSCYLHCSYTGEAGCAHACSFWPNHWVRVVCSFISYKFYIWINVQALKIGNYINYFCFEVLEKWKQNFGSVVFLSKYSSDMLPVTIREINIQEPWIGSIANFHIVRAWVQVP